MPDLSPMFPIYLFRIKNRVYLLAGERSPSCTALNRVKTCKLLHVRSLEAEVSGSPAARAKRIKKGSHRESERKSLLKWKKCQ